MYLRRVGIAALLVGMAGCSTLPTGESPIEAAQRRLPSNPPLVVAEGCLYYRNLLDFNHYLRQESRQLAGDAARAVIQALKERGIPASQFAAPLMCASNLPPRSDETEGRIAESLDNEAQAPLLPFPQSYVDAVGKDPAVRAAYLQLFAACDYKTYRSKHLFECPLLSPAQAQLLRTRLNSSYVMAVSIGGDRASPLHKTGTVAFGLLLGFISIPGDEATARIRLIDLERGTLVWSSFPDEFNGTRPSDLDYELGEGSRARHDDLKVRKGWEARLLKTLFEKQR